MFFVLFLLLSTDIETNPGPRSGVDANTVFKNSFLSFCNWNLNSLRKGDFYRISLVEAHYTIFNNDIISLYVFFISIFKSGLRLDYA